MAVQDSAAGVHHFTLCGGMWSRSFELAPFTNVKTQLSCWPQKCWSIPCGLFGRRPQSPWLLMPRETKNLIGPVRVARANFTPFKACS